MRSDLQGLHQLLLFLSTVAGKGVILDRTATTTCRGV